MTVSYTCQKPIKFWAKCKINLLYKLNQSLLCVPGCPLLLATRLRTRASFLLPLIWCCSLWIRSLPSLPSCLTSHHLACSSHSPALCYPSVHPICFTNPRKTALPTPPLLCSSASPLGQPIWKAPMLFLCISHSLPWLAPDKCPLPFLPLSSYILYNITAPQFLGQ